MQYTVNYNLKKPEGTDIVNIDDLNDNADILDQKLKEVENKADNAPPNSVNDAAIGSRTPDQSQAPASPGTGTLTQLISWLANRIKAITGKTNWWDAPPTTLQAAKNHIDASAPHSGHETPTGAQAKANAAYVAAKQYTDQEVGEVSQELDAQVDAAEARAKAYTDQEVAEVSQALDAHKAEKVTQGVHGLTTTEEITYYVSPTGNDYTGNGSSEKPFATIQHALDQLPLLLIHDVVIQLSPGTYNEDRVSVQNFIGSSTLAIKGGEDKTAGLNFILNGEIFIYSVTLVAMRVQGLTINIPPGQWRSGVKAKCFTFVEVTQCNIDGQNYADSNRAGICSERGSSISVGICNIDNITSGGNYGGALVASTLGSIMCNVITGNNNTVGLYAVAGVIRKQEGINLDATTAEKTFWGGEIR